MRRLLAFAVLALATSGAARPVRVGDALCVSWSGPPLLALAPEIREAYLAALGDAGWRLLRTDFTWARIEPTEDSFDFGAYDDLVDRAAAHEVRVLGLLDYGNPWAAPGTPPEDDHYPPDDPAAFARFAATAARRYRGRIPAWEIWNEPNFSTFWKPNPDPARWAALAAAAARAMGKADRRADVVTGGLAPTLDFLAYGKDWGFLSAAIAADPRLLRRFDAAAVHPYTFLQAPAPEADSNAIGPSVPHQIEHFRERLGEAKAPRLPVWVTEIGWHTALESVFGPGVTEQDQARYLVRSVALALAAGVERVCWYTATDYENFLHDKEAAFGLFRHPPTAMRDPKPAFTAAKTLARVLGGTRFARDLRGELGIPPEAYALCFRSRRPRETIIVLWATRAGVPVTTTASGRVRRIRLVDMDGGESALAGPAVTLTLGPSPVYLVLEEGPA